MKFRKISEKLDVWRKEKDLNDPHAQFMKIVEELGELSEGYVKKDKAKTVDSLGDLLVTIIIFGHQIGLDAEECLNEAWNEIKERKGKTVDGIFIKGADVNIDNEKYIV